MRNTTVLHDTEDKGWWLKHGENMEKEFIKLMNNVDGYQAIINPEKQKDPMLPDIIVNGKLADLKCQNTPFFTSSRYGVDPKYAVTFNRKDLERYRELYPEIDIYFWVEWQQLEWKNNRVDYLAGVFHLPFREIEQTISKGLAKEHNYLNRINDNKGNAKSSFILDLRWFRPILIIE